MAIRSCFAFCLILVLAACRSSVTVALPEDPSIQLYIASGGAFISEKGEATVFPKGGKGIGKTISAADYQLLKADCLAAFAQCEVSNVALAGPGFDMVSITLGGSRTQLALTVGTMDKRPYPEPIKKLIADSARVLPEMAAR